LQKREEEKRKPKSSRPRKKTKKSWMSEEMYFPLAVLTSRNSKRDNGGATKERSNSNMRLFREEKKADKEQSNTQL
jgi:hypothetical protein